MQFRKKPVVIQAFQFQQPTSVDEAPDWLIEAVRQEAFLVVDGVAHITTLEGVMTAQPGDWIIRGVKGELYPCKPDIFAATYDQVAPTTAGTSALQPHQQRVVDEKRDLDEKLGKLGTFFETPIFAGLDEEERQRLEHQQAAMQEYSTILDERIAAFALPAHLPNPLHGAPNPPGHHPVG